MPIIALTAHAMRGDEERARAAGCDHYLAKPISPKKVVEEVRKTYLKMSERERTLYRRFPSTAFMAGQRSGKIATSHGEADPHSGDQRHEYELAPINTIGRHPDNTLQILDRIISKEHAQVLRSRDGRFLLRDLGILNGSFLRGERVREHMLARRRRDHARLDHLRYVEHTETEDSLNRR